MLDCSPDLQTFKICSGTECSPNSCDNTHRQAFIFVQEFPDVCNFLTCCLVNAVQFVRSVQRHLNYSLPGEGDEEMAIMLLLPGHSAIRLYQGRQ